MQSKAEVKDSFKLLLFATALTIALWFIPFAGLIAHPIRLFVTFIHEIGHALAALGTWGEVHRVTLDWSGSGATLTQGGWGLIISSAGYLSTTIYGATLLLLLRRPSMARTAAIFTGILFLLSTVLFAGNSLAVGVGLVFGVGCLMLGVKGKARLVHFLMSFLGIQCLLNAFFDLMTLIYLSAFASGAQTDAQNMSNATGGFIPAIVWAVIWSIISVGVLIGTLMIYYKSLRQRATITDAPMATLLPESFTKTADPRL
jgi:Peptidase M50B-like